MKIHLNNLQDELRRMLIEKESFNQNFKKFKFNEYDFCLDLFDYFILENTSPNSKKRKNSKQNLIKEEKGFTLKNKLKIVSSKIKKLDQTKSVKMFSKFIHRLISYVN